MIIRKCNVCQIDFPCTTEYFFIRSGDELHRSCKDCARERQARRLERKRHPALAADARNRRRNQILKKELPQLPAKESIERLQMLETADYKNISLNANAMYRLRSTLDLDTIAQVTGVTRREILRMERKGQIDASKLFKLLLYYGVTDYSDVILYWYDPDLDNSI